ncbi:hypothetical protein ACO1J6_12115 [Leptospira interrogans serovar Hebdomadis]|uniref:hypothetical protein n=1 Tax=Leptospira interrogans TaxID=173 RepID=UPI0007733927|nr:hypothetical protein [Leptospira interrogans]
MDKRKQKLKNLFAFNRKVGNSKEVLIIISSSLEMGKNLRKLSESQLKRILFELRIDQDSTYKRINKFRENVLKKPPISISELSSLVSIRLFEWSIKYADGKFENIGLQADMKLSRVRLIVLHGQPEYDPF